MNISNDALTGQRAIDGGRTQHGLILYIFEQTVFYASEMLIPMDDIEGSDVKNIGCDPPYIPVLSFLALGRALPRNNSLDIVGYEPAVSFEDGIARTISWYKQQGKF